MFSIQTEVITTLFSSCVKVCAGSTASGVSNVTCPGLATQGNTHQGQERGGGGGGGRLGGLQG